MKSSYYFLRSICLGMGSTLALSGMAQTLDPGFQRPQIMGTGSSGPVAGTVHAIVQQPDGKYIIGGSFSSINGVRARNLARLHADGTLDAAFTAQSQANGPVYSLALQPDGRILAGGQFDSLAGALRPLLGRLAPTGSFDTGFAPNVTVPSYFMQPGTSLRCKIALLPTGNVLVMADFRAPGQSTSAHQLARLSGATGTIDSSFQPSASGMSFAVQPNGFIVLGSGTPSYMQGTLLRRIQPSGVADHSFQSTTTYYTSHISQLLPRADGSFYAAGLFNGLGTNTFVNKMLPNGGFNIGFQYRGQVNSVTAMAEQPNGYLLVAGIRSSGLGAPLTERVGADNGQLDTGYTGANGPRWENNGDQVRQLLVQPDGAIMMAGTFSRAGTTSVYSLVRMLDNNASPLGSKNHLAEHSTAAWPVPARGSLHVRVAIAARPQQVQLLDMLGRVVLSQPVTESEMSLGTANFPAGSYLLKVDYAAGGPVLRRVVLE